MARTLFTITSDKATRGLNAVSSLTGQKYLVLKQGGSYNVYLQTEKASGPHPSLLRAFGDDIYNTLLDAETTSL